MTRYSRIQQFSSLSLLLAPEGRVNSDRCAYFREAETVSAPRPDEPAEIEVLGRRPYATGVESRDVHQWLIMIHSRLAQEFR